MTRSLWCLVLVGAVAAGCGGGGKAAGTESGPCYGNGTCNAGLVCLSDRCVSPGGLQDGGMDGGLGDGGVTDAGSNPFANSCDPRTQVGCDGGQACYLAFFQDGGISESALCRTPGATAVGQPCSATTECVGGAGCVGECVSYCDPALNSPTCVPFDPSGLVGISLPACDAFTQSCGAGSACIYVDTATVCFPVGNSSPDTDGASCAATLRCAAGLQCVLEASDAGTGPVCRPFCDTMSPSACSSCTSVESIEGGPVPDVPDNLGICSTSATRFFL